MYFTKNSDNDKEIFKQSLIKRKTCSRYELKGDLNGKDKEDYFSQGSLF